MKRLTDNKCFMDGECFAKRYGKCTILTNTNLVKCSFQKSHREFTNGKYYPYVSPKDHSDKKYVKTISKGKRLKDALKQRVKVWDQHIGE